ncbi:hypothetical protein ES703_42168 [subsurface metagenome]
MVAEIKITKEEAWASNSLNIAIKETQAELQRAVAARDAFMALLENKYNAKFNPATSRLEPKPKEEPKGD